MKKAINLGSAVPSRDIPKRAQVYLDGQLVNEKLISSTIRLQDVISALDDLADGRVVRTVYIFGD